MAAASQVAASVPSKSPVLLASPDEPFEPVSDGEVRVVAVGRGLPVSPGSNSSG